MDLLAGCAMLSESEGDKPDNVHALQGAESVAALLRTTTALKVVDVGNCDIGLNGVLYLASALAELPSPVLETLILEGCHIMQPPQDHTTLGLAKMLSVNTNLRQLYLPKIGLRDCDFEV